MNAGNEFGKGLSGDHRRGDPIADVSAAESDPCCGIVPHNRAIPAGDSEHATPRVGDAGALEAGEEPEQFTM